MKIDTTTVRLVLAIAEDGSISRAADRLDLSYLGAPNLDTTLARLRAEIETTAWSPA